MLQNSVDALEDAALLGLAGPFLIEVTVNLKENWISVLDTGIGMSLEDVVKVCAPHASLKPHPDLTKKRDKRNAYRGYKGVGLTFLAYGTGSRYDFAVHSKNKTGLTKGRMQYGRAWAESRRSGAPLLVEDPRASVLERVSAGHNGALPVLAIHSSQEPQPPGVYAGDLGGNPSNKNSSVDKSSLAGSRS